MSYKSKFDMPVESRGERWHREVEKENPILSFIAFSTAITLILLIIMMLG